MAQIFRVVFFLSSIWTVGGAASASAQSVRPLLSLSEFSAVRLPDGFSVGGGLLSSTGALLAWSPRQTGVIISGGLGVRHVCRGVVPLAAAFAGSDSILEIVGAVQEAVVHEEEVGPVTRARFEIVATHANPLQEYYSHERSYTATPLRQEDVERYIGWLLASPMSRGFSRIEDARRAVGEALYRPELLPPVTAMLVSDDSLVWLRRGDDSRGRRWTVLHGTGHSHELILPENTTLQAVGGGSAWAFSIRKDGRPLLRLLRLDFHTGP